MLDVGRSLTWCWNPGLHEYHTVITTSSLTHENQETLVHTPDVRSTTNTNGRGNWDIGELLVGNSLRDPILAKAHTTIVQVQKHFDNVTRGVWGTVRDERTIAVVLESHQQSSPRNTPQQHDRGVRHILGGEAYSWHVLTFLPELE